MYGRFERLDAPMNNAQLSKKTRLDHIVDLASAALQTAPFTGGLARYLDEYYPSQQKRTLKFLGDSLKSQSEEVGEIKCDVERLGALVSNVLLESVRTNSEAKRQAFRAVLLNYAKGKAVENHTLDSIMQTVALLTELQIALLQAGESSLEKPIKNEAGAEVLRKAKDLFPDISDEVLLNSYQRLLELGLVNRRYINSTIRSAGGIDIWDIRPSSYGKILLDWIRYQSA